MPTGAAALIIGYGSDLRGDDAVGRVAAERVRAWARPGVRVLSVHQLTPDLAGAIARAPLVLFLDAHPVDRCPHVQVRRLTPQRAAPPAGHTGGPGAVLAWAQLAYDATPAAWWITIPAARFDFGAPLSDGTTAALADALERVRGLLDPAAAADASPPPESAVSPPVSDRRNGPCPTP